MSVVNDILNDLHQRRRSQSYVHSMPFLDEKELSSKVNVSRHFFVMLIILVISSLVMYFSILSSYEPNTLYEDASRLNTPMLSQPTTLGEDDSNSALERSGTKHELTTHDISEEQAVINHDSLRHSALSSYIKPTEESVEMIKEISITQLEVAQPKKPTIKKEAPIASESAYKTRRVTKTNQSIVDNVSTDENLIRKLMIAEPEKVWPYIQKILPVATNKVDLMALGAQGEQRSNQHQTALNLYRTLAEIEPNEAKWKVGSAISLDALSERDQALRHYIQSLKLNRLPPALNTFVRQRIAQLSGPQHE